VSTPAKLRTDAAVHRSVALEFLIAHEDAWSTEHLNRVMITRAGGVDILLRTPSAFIDTVIALGILQNPVSTWSGDIHQGMRIEARVAGIAVGVEAVWRKGKP
jgi:hypothetical protein